MEHDLDRLLRPRSVAIVGASDKPDSNGAAMVRMSRIDGYRGPVWPVNPRLTQIDDLRCYPNLSTLDAVPEHVVIGVASHLVEPILDEAIALGVRSATVFASCFLEYDDTPDLKRRIAEKTKSADLALCGPNCMGFYTPGLGLRVASMPSPGGLKRGGIAWIAQSGSALGALAHNDRRLGFSLCVSTGLELTTTVSDYMDWALHQNETRVIGLFLETVRDPDHFVEMLALACEKNVPVVVLKVGRTEKSAEMAVSHSGALAGDDTVFEAVFRKFGVIRVDDMDEMAATLALFDTDRTAGAGGFGSIHDSGGERELVVDLADDIGLTFAPLAPATQQEMRRHLEAGLTPDNPLDAFVTNQDFEHRYTALIDAMMADPNVALGFFMANPRDGYPYAEGYANALSVAAARTGKPLALVSNYSMTDDAGLARRLGGGEAGIPLLRGTRNALRAAKHLLSYRDFQSRPSLPAPETQTVSDYWETKFMLPQALSEWDGLALLEDFGLLVPRRARADSLETLEQVMPRLAFPLVLKTAEDHAHKSDVGGVVVGIENYKACVWAYQNLAARLGPRVIVMEMVPKGTELALGAIWDDSFGPVVLLSAGGIFIELFDDTVSAVAPFGPEVAVELIYALRINAILRGARGQHAINYAAAAEQISHFSVLVASLGARFSEIDLNPLLCSERGAFAVDSLIVPKPR